MQNLKLYAGVGVVALIVALGVTFFVPAPGQGPQGQRGDRGQDGQSFSAFPGPEITSDFLVINGVEHRYFSSNFRQSTTTPCAFRGSPSATTSLVRVTAQSETSSSTNIRVSWSVGENLDGSLPANDATSTAKLLSQELTITTPNQWFIISTSSNQVISPNGHAILSIAGADTDGGNTDGVDFIGTCNAEFIVL